MDMDVDEEVKEVKMRSFGDGHFHSGVDDGFQVAADFGKNMMMRCVVSIRQFLAPEKKWACIIPSTSRDDAKLYVEALVRGQLFPDINDDGEEFEDVVYNTLPEDLPTEMERFNQKEAQRILDEFDFAPYNIAEFGELSTEFVLVN